MSSISDTGIFLLNIVLKLKDGVKNGSELIFFCLIEVVACYC